MFTTLRRVRTRVERAWDTQSLTVRSTITAVTISTITFSSLLGMTRAVLTWSGSLGAEHWLTRIAQDGVAAEVEETSAQLQAWRESVVDEGHLDVTALATMRRANPALTWSVLGPDGAARGGEACLAPAPLAPEGSIAVYHCLGGPILGTSAVTADGLLVLGERLDDAFVDHFQRAMLVDVVLLDRDGVVASSLRDVDGRRYRPTLRGDAPLPPSDDLTFGVTEVGGGAYGGYSEWGFGKGDTSVENYAAFQEVLPGTELWIGLLVPTRVLNQGTMYTTWLIGGATVLAVLGTIVAATIAIRRMGAPLELLATAAERVADGDLHVQVPESGGGEITELGRTFNRMVEALRERRRELATASRVGGMAEMATGVLHNVGNVLTSVNVSADSLGRRVRGMRGGRLVEAVGLLHEHQDNLCAWLRDDPRGRAVLPYLETASRAVVDDQAALLHELDCLRENLTRMQAVIETQQTYARTVASSTVERVEQVVDDAIQIVRPSLTKHHIELVTRFGPCEPVVIDTPRVVNILVNLLRNAKDAVVALPGSERRITVETHVEGGRLSIDVTDDGIGIAPEVLPALFSFGHTTKVDGHGFGLHMSALAARELGGDLRCRSAGSGAGATFTLELPIELAQAVA